MKRLDDGGCVGARCVGLRRVVIAIAFVGTLIGADLAVRSAKSELEPYAVRPYEAKLRLIERERTPEILLVGSSRVKYALVPDEFRAATGLYALNLGVGAAKTAEWKLLLDRVLETARPRLVVLGVNASELRADYLPTEAALQLFDSADFLESLRFEGFSWDVFEMYARRSVGPGWAVFDRRHEVRLAMQERMAAILPKQAQMAREMREYVSQPQNADGFDHPWLHDRRTQNLERRLLENANAVLSASVPAFDRGASAFERLGGLIDRLNSAGIPIVLAYVPNSPRTEKRWREVEPKFVETIGDICRERGAAFVACFQADLPRTDSDYIEETHVGLPLARRISRRLAERVVALGLLSEAGSRLARQNNDDDEAP